MTSQELKAIAYDIISNIEFLKNKLAEINQDIAKTIEQEKQQDSGNANSGNNNN